MNSRPSNNITIKVPAVEEGRQWLERKLDVIVVSDAYLGVKWEVKGVEIPTPPRPVADDVKEKKTITAAGEGTS